MLEEESRFYDAFSIETESSSQEEKGTYGKDLYEIKGLLYENRDDDYYITIILFIV